MTASAKALWTAQQEVTLDTGVAPTKHELRVAAESSKAARVRMSRLTTLHQGFPLFLTPLLWVCLFLSHSTQVGPWSFKHGVLSPEEALAATLQMKQQQKATEESRSRSRAPAAQASDLCST